MNSNPLPNWPLLGLIRFLLAFVVALSHLYICLPRESWLVRLGNQLGPFDAVAGFFLISGFSIAASIQRSPGPMAFYRRRLVRLAPVYYAVLLLALSRYSVVVHDATGVPGPTTATPGALDLAGAALMMSGLIGLPFEAIFQTWTLSIEIVYYAVAPMLRKWQKMVWPLILLSAALFWHQGSGPRDYSAQPLWSIFPLAWMWLLGWQTYRQRPALWLTIVVLALFWLLFNPTFKPENPLEALPWVSASAACLYGHKLVLSQAVARFFTTLGDISYPLYLGHALVYLACQQLSVDQFGSRWSPLVPLSAILAAALAQRAVVLFPQLWLRRRTAQC